MEGAKKMAALMRVESQFDMGASSMHKGILVLFFFINSRIFVVGSNMGQYRVITENVKNCTYFCYVGYAT